MLAFVGCLNRAAPYEGKSRGQGIAVLSFDPDTGALTALSETTGVDNPSFLVVAADGRTLYATSEVYEWHEGVVTAYRIRADGVLTYINKQATGGSIAAQAIQDPSGRWILVVNYRLGPDGVRQPLAISVHSVAEDGGVGPFVHGVSHSGRGANPGPNPDRQEGPHPHCVLATPDGRAMLVADLGLDRLIAYRFDSATGNLMQAGEAVMPPGTGPRHLDWVRPGLAVVSGELDNTVTSFAWDGGGDPRLLATETTLPDGFSGVNHAADIHAAPDGRFVYASNRGHDSIAVVAVDREGTLKLIGHRAVGRTPRNFTLDPTGRFVLVAGQDAHEVTVHRRDAETGLLSDPVSRVNIGSPMCVRLSP